MGTSDLITLDKWLSEIGITNATRWRWEQKGWIKTILISNRRYVRREDHEEFLRRAAAGEFEQKPKVPSRQKEEVDVV